LTTEHTEKSGIRKNESKVKVEKHATTGNTGSYREIRNRSLSPGGEGRVRGI